MNWYPIVLMVLSAVLAILIASFIFGRKPKKEIYINYALVVLLVFALLSALSKEFILPEINSIKITYDVKKTLSAIPGMERIKMLEPGTYTVLVETLIGLHKMGSREKDDIYAVRKIISSMAQRWLPNASNQAIISNIKVIIDELNELQGQSGDPCFKLLFPEDGNEIDGRKILSKEMQKRDLAALNLVSRT